MAARSMVRRQKTNKASKNGVGEEGNKKADQSLDEI